MISKKTRFEVFKRDGFQCAYCGKTPPEVTLEVDHIEPISKGGKDDINNLLTACFDCNRGKTNIKLDKIPAKLNENLEVLREKEEQLKAYRNFVIKIEKRIQSDIEKINEVYKEYFPGWAFSERFKNASLKTFLKHLLLNEIIDCLHIACSKKDRNNAIPYFCGICWNKIKGTIPWWEKDNRNGNI